jgi:phenylacetic acid degradation operon negative regulatory protein
MGSAQPVKSNHVLPPAHSRLRPRSMLFTLFGDYVYPQGREIRLAALVAIGKVLGMSETAVRSAVARLAREGWIVAQRRGRSSFYRLSPAGRSLIEEGTRRIYRPNGGAWDGSWCLLTYSIPETQRALRDRLRKQLAWLGFGQLGAGVYLAARDRSLEAARLAGRVGTENFARTFLAKSAGRTSDRQLVAVCWDLQRIARAYRSFIARYARRYANDRLRARRHALADVDAFVTRFMLTHDFRRFPFIDPNLPDALLPKRWAGKAARKLFERYHAMLTDGALRFFASVMRSSSSG